MLSCEWLHGPMYQLTVEITMYMTMSSYVN